MKDCSVKRASAPVQPGPSDQVNQLASSGEVHPSGCLQSLILKELQRVNSKLDRVESEVHRQHMPKKDCHKYCEFGF